MDRKQRTVSMIESWQDDTEFLRKLGGPACTYKEAVAFVVERGTMFFLEKDWILPKEGMYPHVKSIAIEFQLLKFGSVLADLDKKRSHQRQARKNLLLQMGLSSRDTGGDFLEANSIPIYKVTVQSRERQYPPHNHWVYEQENIGDQWRSHLVGGKMKDKRNPRYPLHLLDPGQLQLDIPAHKSAIFIDSITGELVGLVLRNFSGGNLEVLEWAVGVALEATEWQKSVRQDNTGSIVIEGFTAGQRSCPKFDWVNNLNYKFKNKPIEVINNQRCRVASLFGLGWNLMKKKSHPAVVDDFQTYVKKYGLPRMAPPGQEGYTIKVGSQILEFRGEESAPPSGCISTNFSRYMHTEKNGNQYVAFWNLARTHGTEAGANFFIASYGIRICNSPDSHVALRASDSHGTSLPIRTNDFMQTGPAFLIGNRLAQQWKKYAEGMVSRKEIEDDLVNDHADSGDEIGLFGGVHS